MKKNRTKKETSPFIKLAIFAFAVFAVIMIVNLQLKVNEYSAKVQILEAEKAELTDKRNELLDEVNADVDEEYIIEQAKEKLNLRMPEEIIFYNDLFS